MTEELQAEEQTKELGAACVARKELPFSDKDWMNRETNQIEEKWARMLENVHCSHRRRCAAVAMENQRLMNDRVMPSEVDEEHPIFKRISIPLVRRVYGDGVFNDLVSVQPLLGPTGLVYQLEKEGFCPSYKNEAIVAITRRLKTRWPAKQIEEIPSKYVTCLDGECEVTFSTAASIADEIAREVVTDLKNNSVPVDVTIDKWADLPAAMSGEVTMMPKPATWAVVSKATAEKLACHLLNPPDPFTQNAETKVVHVGEMKLGEHVVRVYADHEFPDDRVLLGYKGRDQYDSGYVYSPYVPMSVCSVADQDPGILARYGKKLLKGGHEYYRLMKLTVPA